MDSREPPPPPQPQQPPVSSQLHLHQHHTLPQHMISFPHSMINHSPSGNPNVASNPNSVSAGFPFNSVGSHPPTTQSQDSSRPQPKISSDLVGGVFDGSPPPASRMGFSIEPAKKRRGRPRKYTPDGNIALGLSPTGISSSGGLPALCYGESGGNGGTSGGLCDQATKRNRGRPPGSGKRQLDALGGVGGIGFTPHVITVNAGEDVASKIMAFSQQGPRTVCILSANGAICNVTLRQPATSGGTISYEGRYEIISLSGSYFFSPENGSCRSGGLSVSLAAPDGHVVGGGVAGMLMAASIVQVIVGSFVTDGKKSGGSAAKSGSASAPPQMLAFGATHAGSSPPSHGHSSDSSDENAASPLNRGGAAFYGNPAPPVHNMPMYPLWAAQNP